MANEKEVVKITFGGWYQRTTLHLSEIYQFLTGASSKLDLDKTILKQNHKKLNLKSVSRETGYLDYIKAVTKDGIEIRYYEDGLYVLEKDSEDILNTLDEMKEYYEVNFKPAISYIFSLGAPTPKILSNIKDEHPVVISKIDRFPSKYTIDTRKYGEIDSETSSREISVFKTKDFIFVIGTPVKKDSMRFIIEMHIFFTEFKHQLHKYLNIHRKIWEEIANIKEQKYIKGKEVEFFRSKLESYKKTIDLITNRINQMPSYAHTRASLAKNLNIEKSLVTLFQYKFEDLFNSLDYIKEIWVMTLNYVNSAINVFVELGNKSSISGIRSIQLLTSIGVLTGIIGYLTRDSLPTISLVGLAYLVILILSVIAIDFLLKGYAKNKKYEIKFVDTERQI